MRVTVDQMEKWENVLEPTHIEIDHHLPQRKEDILESGYDHHTVLRINSVGLDRILHVSEWAVNGGSARDKAAICEYPSSDDEKPVGEEECTSRVFICGEKDQHPPFVYPQEFGISEVKTAVRGRNGNRLRSRSADVSLVRDQDSEVRIKKVTPSRTSLTNLISGEISSKELKKDDFCVGFVGKGISYPLSAKTLLRNCISAVGGVEENRYETEMGVRDAKTGMERENDQDRKRVRDPENYEVKMVRDHLIKENIRFGADEFDMSNWNRFAEFCTVNDENSDTE